MPTQKLLTGRQLAVELGVAERTVATWRQRNIVPVISLGHRSKFFVLADVVAALNRRTIKPRS